MINKTNIIFKCPACSQWSKIKVTKKDFKAECEDTNRYKLLIRADSIKKLLKLLDKLGIATCGISRDLKFKWDSAWGCFKTQKVVRNDILGYYTLELEDNKLVIMFSIAEEQEGDKDFKLKEFEKNKIQTAKAWCQKDYIKKGNSYEYECI